MEAVVNIGDVSVRFAYVNRGRRLIPLSMSASLIDQVSFDVQALIRQ